MRVNELDDGQLALWVARGLALEDDIRQATYGHAWMDGDNHCYLVVPGYLFSNYHQSKFDPVNDWNQGRIIVDRMWSVHRSTNASLWSVVAFDNREQTYWGATLTVAACRAFVASKFGDNLTEAMQEYAHPGQRTFKLRTQPALNIPNDPLLDEPD